MVKIIRVGVLCIQGGISEHITITNTTFKEKGINGECMPVKTKQNLLDIDALIIPGGESSTISKGLIKKGMFTILKERIKQKNLPILGTCAGCVLLASTLTASCEQVSLLQAIDMQVQRNGFGPQKKSFEHMIDIKGFIRPYPAVFIRAPIIKKIGSSCEIIATLNSTIIGAKQDQFLALSFHPELTKDTRMHHYFFDMFI